MFLIQITHWNSKLFYHKNWVFVISDKKSLNLFFYIIIYIDWLIGCKWFGWKGVLSDRAGAECGSHSQSSTRQVIIIILPILSF